MRLFVTGGTGFIGGRVVERLAAGGNEVVAVSRRPETAGEPPAGVTVIEGDITEPASLREPMRGADGVIHMAAWYDVGPGPWTGELAGAVNVDGTRAVLGTMADLDVPRGVYVSSLAVNSDTRGRIADESYRYDGPHVSVYDRTKWEAHYEVVAPMVAAGLPVVTVMPGTVYGPGDRGPVRERLWRPYLGRALPAVSRETGFAFGHVDDTADAIVRAWENGDAGEEYIVCGHNRRLTEVLALAERLTGVPAPRALPPGVFGGLARAVGHLEPAVRPPAGYESEALRALAGVTYFGDNTKARRELGIEHRPLADGLREYLEWEQGDGDSDGWAETGARVV
jgi:dihydroflavonol-4-reductase